MNKPIGASPRRWLGSCCLGLLGLLCCDHDDRVFPYNGYGNSMSIYVRNPSASLKDYPVYGCLQSGFYCRWLWFVILAGLYLFWRVCLVSFWREQTYVGIHMDNFGRQKFDSDGQFCASDTQTDRQTDTRTHF